jgi:hypothetical protein
MLGKDSFEFWGRRDGVNWQMISARGGQVRGGQVTSAIRSALQKNDHAALPQIERCIANQEPCLSPPAGLHHAPFNSLKNRSKCYTKFCAKTAIHCLANCVIHDLQIDLRLGRKELPIANHSKAIEAGREMARTPREGRTQSIGTPLPGTTQLAF